MKAPEHDDEEGRPVLLSPTWTIWADVSITRRKWYHLITDPDGLVVWRSRLFGPALGFLIAEGVTSFRLCTETETYMIPTIDRYPMKGD